MAVWTNSILPYLVARHRCDYYTYCPPWSRWGSLPVPSSWATRGKCDGSQACSSVFCNKHCLYTVTWQQLRPIWFLNFVFHFRRDDIVGTMSGYGLDDRAIEVRSSVEAKDFSSSLCVQTGSGAHPASCTMVTGGKARPRRDADHSPPSSAEVESE
jgi:hypothetical protein